jgi:hypothetical protein
MATINFEAGSVSITGSLQSQAFRLVDTEGETTLDISALEQTVQGIQSDLNDEITNRQTADSTLTSNLQSETLNRQSADDQLQANIDVVASDLTTEITNRQTADSQLQSNIESVVTDLTTEINDRESADTTLQANINTVALDLATETTARENAVSTLESAIELKAPINSPSFTGTVTGITKTMVGLSNVDNTSDADKPISTATQSALDLKSSITYVDQKMADLVNSSPETLDTLNELALAIGNDANFAVSTATSIGLRATTEYVNEQLALKQNILTFDDAPTQDSVNPVRSGGIFTSISQVRSDLTSNVNAITTAYTSADSVLSGRITSAESNIASVRSDLTSNVNAITTAYTSADSVLSERITSAESNITSVRSDLTSNVNAITTAYTSADSVLSGRIDDAEGNIMALQTEVSTTITSALASLRSDIDSNVASITSSFQNGDSVLSGRIDDAEANIESAKSNLQSTIDQVVLDYQDADNSILNRLVSLEETDLSQYANIEIVKSNVSVLQAQVSVLAGNVATLSTDLDALESQAGGISANLSSLSSGFTSNIASLTSTISSLDLAYQSADDAINSRINSTDANVTTLSSTVSSNYNTLDSAISSLDSAYKTADTQLEARVNANVTTVANNLISNVSTLTTRINEKANINAPTFTGLVTSTGNIKVYDGSNELLITPTSLILNGGSGNLSIDTPTNYASNIASLETKTQNLTANVSSSTFSNTVFIPTLYVNGTQITGSSNGGGGSITVDTTPTSGSTNAVSSGGVFTALASKQETLSSSSNITVQALNVVGDLNIDTNLIDTDPINNRVGINKSDPAYTLDVSGNVNCSGSFLVNGAVPNIPITVYPFARVTTNTTYQIPNTGVIMVYITATNVTINTPVSPVDGQIIIVHYHGTSASHTINVARPSGVSYTILLATTPNTITNSANGTRTYIYHSASNNWSWWKVA